MTRFLTSIYNFLKGEKFTALGHTSYAWTNGDRETSRYDVVFLLGDKGSRDVKIKEHIIHEGYTGTAKNHTYYRTYVTPWLEKCAWAQSEDPERLRELIEFLCYDKEPERQKKRVGAKPVEGTDNVVEFPSNDDK